MIHFKTPPNSLRIRHRQIQKQQRLLCFSEKPLLFFSLPMLKSRKSPKFGNSQSETTFIVKITVHPQNRNHSKLHCTVSKICPKACQSLVIIRKLPAKKEKVVCTFFGFILICSASLWLIEIVVDGQKFPLYWHSGRLSNESRIVRKLLHRCFHLLKVFRCLDSNILSNWNANDREELFYEVSFCHF